MKQEFSRLDHIYNLFDAFIKTILFILVMWILDTAGGGLNLFISILFGLVGMYWIFYPYFTSLVQEYKHLNKEQKGDVA